MRASNFKSSNSFVPFILSLPRNVARLTMSNYEREEKATLKFGCARVVETIDIFMNKVRVFNSNRVKRSSK